MTWRSRGQPVLYTVPHKRSFNLPRFPGCYASQNCVACARLVLDYNQWFGEECPKNSTHIVPDFEALPVDKLPESIDNRPA